MIITPLYEHIEKDYKTWIEQKDYLTVFKGKKIDTNKVSLTDYLLHGGCISPKGHTKEYYFIFVIGTAIVEVGGNLNNSDEDYIKEIPVKNLYDGEKVDSYISTPVRYYDRVNKHTLYKFLKKKGYLKTIYYIIKRHVQSPDCLFLTAYVNEMSIIINKLQEEIDELKKKLENKDKKIV